MDSQVKLLVNSLAAMGAVRMLTGAFHVFYLLSLEVTLYQVALLQIVFCIAYLLFEVPTGIIGDKLGAKNNIILSCLLYSLYFPLCTLAPNMMYLIVAEVFYALGTCFSSGADNTWLRFKIDELNNKNEKSYHKYIARIRESRALQNSLAGSIGVLIVYYFDNFKVIYYLSSILFVALVPIFMNINEPKSYEIKETGNTISHVKNCFFGIITTKYGIYYISISVLIIAALQPVFHYWQPFILEQSGIAKIENNRESLMILGICFVSYSTCKYIFNRFLVRNLLENHDALKVTYYVTLMAAATMFAMISLEGSIVSVFLFTLFHSLFSVTMTQYDSEYFNHIEKNKSNTILSIVSLIARVGGIVTLLILGWITTFLPLNSVFIFSLSCIIGIIPINYLWIRLNYKSEPKPEIG